MTEMTVQIHGLLKLDVKEIEDEDGVRFEKQMVPEGSHGEVALFTAIFAMSALTTLAAYLLRKHDNQTFEETVEIQHPDGRSERRVVKWSSASSEAPEADIIRQIRGPDILR